MSRYNTSSQTKPEKITNLQGGTGFKIDPKLELISILVTGLDKTYYQSLGERENRLRDLISNLSKTNPEFVAKALIYARSVVGQRSVSHFGAVNIAPLLSGNILSRKFFSKRDRKENRGGIIYRLDDILEIVACYQHFNPGKPLPNGMKKGFKDALEKADAYELAKYQGKGKKISLVDIVNLVHPHPTNNMQETFKLLMEGALKQFDTVEDKNTSAGQEVAKKVKEGKITKEEAQKELTEMKQINFEELINSRKIGYLALIRNLRNIIKTNPNKELVEKTCELITDEKLIRQSLVFPHQIDLALEIMLSELGEKKVSPYLKALNKAYELSIPNLTELFQEGRTAVVVDTSGSMYGWGNGINIAGTRTNKSPMEKASLIGATLAKGVEADFYQFGDRCAFIKYNPLDSINTIKNKLLSEEGRVGHGTRYDEIFKTLGAKGKYNRIFIISDLQGGDSVLRNSHYSLYKQTYGEPYIYTIDLVGYGSTMFKPNSKLIQLFGYSSDIYEMVKKAEIDPKAILKEIESIVI